MTALHPTTFAEPRRSARHAAHCGCRAALFAVTLFLSALLLFAVQPMFTKMVLPRLGGAPTVWSVAMVFFQAALLAGYAYAHLLIRYLPLGLARLLHLGVLAAAALTLPIGIAHGFGAPPTQRHCALADRAVRASRSACRSRRCRRARRCCRAGSPRAAIRRRTIPTCSMRRPISDRLRR